MRLVPFFPSSRFAIQTSCSSESLYFAPLRTSQYACNRLNPLFRLRVSRVQDESSSKWEKKGIEGMAPGLLFQMWRARRWGRSKSNGSSDKTMSGIATFLYILKLNSLRLCLNIFIT
ncbi:hypothetical protein FGO68_gene8518 [Halteria grandinella]|uniref:Uncharacterized protein n=1 Tax=Halteria grandinella TaxID=5974 RepID=A0A8J8NXL7_HALGN|nr:hypothetical protein FGO68_gene8518 [Halteria grandinella]